jgi:hypothetical protein
LTRKRAAKAEKKTLPSFSEENLINISPTKVLDGRVYQRILTYDKGTADSHTNNGNSITSLIHAEFETLPEYSQHDREFTDTNRDLNQ